MHPLGYFIGDWRAEMRDPTSGVVMTMTYRVAPVLRDRWLCGRADVPQLGVSVQDFWGADAATAEIVRVVFDSNGTYGIVRSVGWTGSELTLDGVARTKDGEIRVRELITRLNDEAFRAVWQKLRGGEWVVYSEELLTRVEQG